MADTGAVRIGAEAARRLAAAGTVTVQRGMSDDEFARVENDFGFEFADDHRSFLAAGLPVGALWPDWRGEGRRSLTKRLQLPIEGILFAVEWDGYWHGSWGQRPARMKDALRSARYHLERVPRLIPVYSHTYLTGGHGAFRRPVLSVVRTAVTVRGTDLADYIHREFGDGTGDPADGPTVDFWSDLAS
jgi:hypothetical protein